MSDVRISQIPSLLNSTKDAQKNGYRTGGRAMLSSVWIVYFNQLPQHHNKWAAKKQRNNRGHDYKLQASNFPVTNTTSAPEKKTFIMGSKHLK